MTKTLKKEKKTSKVAPKEEAQKKQEFLHVEEPPTENTVSAEESEVSRRVFIVDVNELTTIKDLTPRGAMTVSKLKDKTELFILMDDTGIEFGMYGKSDEPIKLRLSYSNFMKLIKDFKH